MLDSLIGVLTFLKDLRYVNFEKEDNIAKAITALRTAIRETRTQIESDGYEPNSKVSDLWLKAFDAFQRARLKNRMLYDKARFWEDPKSWINEPGSMKLIPKLNELETECESLLVRIGKI